MPSSMKWGVRGGGEDERVALDRNGCREEEEDLGVESCSSQLERWGGVRWGLCSLSAGGEQINYVGRGGGEGKSLCFFVLGLHSVPRWKRRRLLDHIGATGNDIRQPLPHAPPGDNDPSINLLMN